MPFPEFQHAFEHLYPKCEVSAIPGRPLSVIIEGLQRKGYDVDTLLALLATHIAKNNLILRYKDHGKTDVWGASTFSDISYDKNTREIIIKSQTGAKQFAQPNRYLLNAPDENVTN